MDHSFKTSRKCQTEQNLRKSNTASKENKSGNWWIWKVRRDDIMFLSISSRGSHWVWDEFEVQIAPSHPFCRISVRFVLISLCLHRFLFRERFIRDKYEAKLWEKRRNSRRRNKSMKGRKSRRRRRDHYSSDDSDSELSQSSSSSPSKSSSNSPKRNSHRKSQKNHSNRPKKISKSSRKLSSSIDFDESDLSSFTEFGSSDDDNSDDDFDRESFHFQSNSTKIANR